MLRPDPRIARNANLGAILGSSPKKTNLRAGNIINTDWDNRSSP
jgi:hypothetical protein